MHEDTDKIYTYYHNMLLTPASCSIDLFKYFMLHNIKFIIKFHEHNFFFGKCGLRNILNIFEKD